MWPVAAGSEPDMVLEHVIGLVVSVLLLGYLTYALLRPERF
jgi:K+-transporting ATPase KdpF subunit